MWNYIIFFGIFLVLPNIIDSSRVRRNYGGRYDDNFANHYTRHVHKNRQARNRFHVRDVDGGEMDSIESAGTDAEYPNPTDEGIESVGVYFPTFDTYNLNEMEIAIAQTLYLLIVPEIQRAVDFKMNEIVDQYLLAPFGGPPPGFKPPKAISPTRTKPGMQLSGQNQHNRGRPESSKVGAPKPHEPIVPLWDYTRPNQQGSKQPQSPQLQQPNQKQQQQSLKQHPQTQQQQQKSQQQTQYSQQQQQKSQQQTQYSQQQQQSQQSQQRQQTQYSRQQQQPQQSQQRQQTQYSQQQQQSQQSQQRQQQPQYNQQQQPQQRLQPQQHNQQESQNGPSAASHNKQIIVSYHRVPNQTPRHYQINQ